MKDFFSVAYFLKEPADCHHTEREHQADLRSSDTSLRPPAMGQLGHLADCTSLRNASYVLLRTAAALTASLYPGTNFIKASSNYGLAQHYSAESGWNWLLETHISREERDAGMCLHQPLLSTEHLHRSLPSSVMIRIMWFDLCLAARYRYFGPLPAQGKDHTCSTFSENLPTSRDVIR